MGISRLFGALARSLGLALVPGWVLGGAAGGWAHETDNFYLPLEAELADVGDFLGALHTWAIEEAVQELNGRIEHALAIQDPAVRAKRLAQCHDPYSLAAAVFRRFGDAFTETWRASRTLRGSWARQAYPGKKPSHAGIKMNLVGHFPLDPRALVMLFQADTLKAWGVYFGTDKLTHLHQLGWAYYRRHQALLAKGWSREDAYRKVLEQFASTGFLAEKNLFGSIGTGVYSNADMCANHLGFKFFLNLTEKVRLKGQEREPLVARCGVFWRVQQHVRPQSGWFGAFVSDHWNEALNPSLYDPTMRPGIRRVLRNRAEQIVRFYTEKDGRPADPAYFEQLARQLATYYGEPYGHSGHFDKLLHIGNVCFPALAERNARPAASRQD